jgi:hypothetical protein
MNRYEPKWKVGDRVTRLQYMDDGTWSRLGDKCLPESPLKHGTVIQSVTKNTSRDAVTVLFDDGTERTYLEHGIERE